MKEDRELKEFRDLMPVPDHWDEGFGVKAMVGGLFVGMVMTPASMYMNLVMGGGVGGAAQWVTIILFLEVARRSFTVLKRPEIYVLYYMAGASLVTFPPLLWNQFLPQSEMFRQFNLADKIPPWVSPSSPDVLGLRTFFHPAWLAPIGLLALGMLLGRLDSFSLGYILFRLTSDGERLPFPMAPVGAQGITALADASDGKETWRWRVFSFGAMLGLTFGTLYLALPAISGAFLTEPISIFPLPFKDLTSNTETFLPAVPFMLSFDIGLIIFGMVLPFWAMVGSFLGLLICMVMNPVLHNTGVLKSWREGVGALATINSNYLDFYLSFGLGLTAAIAVIGFVSIIQGLMAKKKDIDEQAVVGLDWGRFLRPPPGRGDFPLWIAAAIYVVSTAAVIAIAIALLSYAHSLSAMNSAVTPLLVGVLIFYGFIYTPLISYVSARMEGVVGQSTQIPFVREATFILTGYQGAAIWFTPFPANNHGWQALYFRQTELTGTSFRSMVKAEIFILPVVFVATIVFSQFIWRIAPVPSSAFPYAEKLWEVNAFRQAVIFSSTLPGGQQGPFFEAFKPLFIFIGLAVALLSYGLMSFLGLPVLMVYGVIRGLDQSTPDAILPQFAGALLGRYYFAKKYGDMWPQYRVVFAAGFGCGMGLIMMLSLGLVFMSKSVFQSTF